LTIAQAIVANWLLERAERRQPLTDPLQYRARLGGIISSVKAGRVKNPAWGRSMLAGRGGRTMATHGLHHLRAIAPLGAEASRQARERQQAAAHWEQTGGLLPLGAKPAQSVEAERLRRLEEAWEAQQSQQRSFLTW